MVVERLGAETLAAAAASTFALSLAAKIEGRGGAAAAERDQPPARRKRGCARDGLGLADDRRGLATHLAATGFWAAIYEGWLSRGSRSAADIVGKAVAMAGVSALVDYRATPKRFTPGWEFVLTPGAMAVAYLALGARLAAGGATGRRSGRVDVADAAREARVAKQRTS